MTEFLPEIFIWGGGGGDVAGGRAPTRTLRNHVSVLIMAPSASTGTLLVMKELRSSWMP